MLTKIKIMKKKIYPIAIVLFLATIISCKKKEIVTPTIVGFWTGDVTLYIHENNYVRYFASSADTSAFIDGIYENGSDSLRIYFLRGSGDPNEIELSAKLNSNSTQMSGIYRYPNATDFGNWTVTKR